MKIYQLFVSRSFLSGHKRIGQSTGFKESILNNNKKHTLRQNAKYWITRLNSINEKKGYLSLREWSGSPRHSDAIEFKRLYSCSYELIEKINGIWQIKDTKEILNVNVLAQNDGLSVQDFNEWFSFNNYTDIIIIHFTELKYSKIIPLNVSIKNDYKETAIQTSLEFIFDKQENQIKPVYSHFNREY